MVRRSLTNLMVLASYRDLTWNPNNPTPPMRSSEAEVRQPTLMIVKTPAPSFFLEKMVSVLRSFYQGIVA